MSAQLKWRLSFCLQKSTSLLLLNSAFRTITSEASYGRWISIHFSKNFHRNTEKTQLSPWKLVLTLSLSSWRSWSEWFGINEVKDWRPGFCSAHLAFHRCVFIHNVDSPVLPALVCLLNEPFVLWNRPWSELGWRVLSLSSRLPSHQPCFLWSGRERELNRLLVLVGTAHGHAAWKSTQHSDWLLGAVFANLIHPL